MTNIKGWSNFLLAAVAACYIPGCNDPEQVRTKGSSQELQHTNTVLPIDDFVKWTAAKENELSKTKELNELNFKLSFMPAHSLAYIELKGEKYSAAVFDSVCRDYSQMSYFNLRIETPNRNGELLKYDLHNGQEYNDRITYMSFGMQRDIYLVQGNDTLYPGLYHFERIFEIAPYATVMLAFDNSKFKQENEFTIVYDDHLFDKGFLKYIFYPNQLIDLPKISGV